MGFGTKILFMLMLGILVLGPKRLHTMLGHVARAMGTSEPSSHPGIGTANPPVRLTQEQSFHAAGSRILQRKSATFEGRANIS